MRKRFDAVTVPGELLDTSLKLIRLAESATWVQCLANEEEERTLDADKAAGRKPRGFMNVARLVSKCYKNYPGVSSADFLFLRFFVV